MINNYTSRVKHLDNGLIVLNERVTIVPSDWDSQCLHELSTGEGFRITEKGKTDVDTDPGLYSIHSPLYGTSYDDPNSFADRYSCKCGRYIGKHYADSEFVCPKCKHKVEFIDIDMTKTGWIILDKDFIIQSEFYKKIGSFIGNKVFDRILFFKQESERIQPAGEPYAYIGSIQFRENFAEIMEFYYKKNKKTDAYLFIMSNISNIFVHCIPVYNMQLRQFLIKGEDVRYSDEDKLYRKIFSDHLLLNDNFALSRRIETTEKRNKNDKEKMRKSVGYLRRENILYRIQKDLDALWVLSFETIDKKTGLIKSQILGGRTNYTARNVIIPDIDLRSDEVKFGYITFLETYKLELISLLVKTYNVDYNEANRIWDESTMIFSDEIYQLMNYIIKVSHPVVSIGRNPSEQKPRITQMKLSA